jgi:hypothetical protein
MSIRNAQISSSLVSKMLNRPVENIFSKPIQHQIYNVTGGVERLVGGAVTSLVVIASDLVLLLVILIGLMLVETGLLKTHLLNTPLLFQVDHLMFKW